MKLVIFGLTISSSWGNGHATLWRALCRALHRRGHEIVFFERDVTYYASHRDLTELEGTRIVFYDDWTQIESAARREVSDADIAMVTSYCPDGPAASRVVLESTGGTRPLRCTI
jgi:spore maturation protein CgeB